MQNRQIRRTTTTLNAKGNDQGSKVTGSGLHTFLPTPVAFVSETFPNNQHPPKELAIMPGKRFATISCADSTPFVFED